MSRWGLIMPRHVATMVMVDELWHSMACSMSGIQSAKAAKSLPPVSPHMERTMLLITDIVTKKGDRIGERRIRVITPGSADKIYDIICNGPRCRRPRQGERVG